MPRWLSVLLLATLGLNGTPVSADTLRIAVASNFAHAMQALGDRFEADSRHSLTVSLGSTGKHFAQITNGAPFDIFLAADAERPARLEREGRIVIDSRFTYAIGRLAIWAPPHSRMDLPADLTRDEVARVAIANPRLAPYGRAAHETLKALGLWTAIEQKLVRGENIAQAFQFVFTGNADSGLIAQAQLAALSTEISGTVWEVPAELHAPIVQQAVLLRDSKAARAFLAFLRTETARAIITSAGYEAP